jgi:beta-mannanase
MRPTPRHSRPPVRSTRASGAPHHVRQPDVPPRRAGRALIYLIVLALLVGLTASAGALAPFQGPTGQDALQPRSAWLGAWVKPTGSYTKAAQQAAVLELEAKIGRRLAIDHTYVPWGHPLGWRPAWDVAQGRIPLITIGASASTRDVASGRHDVYLRSLTEAVRALGQPVFLRYAHKMDASTNRSWVGSPADFVAAWRHLHDVFAGLPVSWVWAPSASAFDAGGAVADQYYPGDQYVDWISADGYNSFGCNGSTTWRGLADLFGAFYAWGSGRQKPLMIAETGSTEDPADPARKARWFEEAARTLATSMPNVQALVYFDSDKGCDWRVESSAQSLDGFRRLAQDPHFQTQPLPSTTTITQPPTPSSQPTPTTAPSTTAPPPTTTPPSGGGGSLSALLVPSQGALWGTSRFSTELEGQLGRRLDIAHYYHRWDQPFPTSSEQQVASGGRILLLNWKPMRNGAVVPWSAVADGREDAQIATTANRLKAFGRKVFLAFHHEPEDDLGRWGSASDYARAFRHVRERFDQLGVTNVVFVWNTMGWINGREDLYAQLYPGDSVVDWIAFDAYNWYGCRSGDGARSFARITQGMYEWARAHHPGKPIMLAEYGVMEDQPAGMPSKAQWFRDALEALKTSRTQIKALVYFNTGPPEFGHCNWRVTSSAASLQSYREIGLSSHLNTRS